MPRLNSNGRGALRTIAVLLVRSNLVISVAATSVALWTARLAGLDPEFLPLFIVFAATFFVYSLNRLTDIKEDSRNVPGRAAFVSRYGTALFAAGAGLYLVAIAGAFAFGLPGAPFLALPAVVAGLYSLVRVKRLLFVKNLVVGGSWGIIPLGVGVYYGVVRTPEILVSFGLVTVMLTVAAAVFDIKDLEGDRAEGIRTAPVVFGPGATRTGAFAATVAVAVALVALVVAGVVPERFLSALGFLAYVAAYVPFATTDRGPLFYGLVIDGEHVFFAALVVAIYGV